MHCCQSDFVAAMLGASLGMNVFFNMLYQMALITCLTVTCHLITRLQCDTQTQQTAHTTAVAAYIPQPLFNVLVCFYAAATSHHGIHSFLWDQITCLSSPLLMSSRRSAARLI